MIKYIYILLLFIYLDCNIAKSQSICEDTTQNISKILTDSLQEDFVQQAEELVNQLSESITIIVDNTQNDATRLTHKDIALKLFANDTCKVEITSTKDQSKKKKRKIRTYLDNLYNLDKITYNKVSSRWFNIRVCKNFCERVERDKSGAILLDKFGEPIITYWGYAQFCQEFKAQSKFKSTEIKAQYDIVNVDCKRVQIIVKKGDLNGKEVWLVRLGDITVEDYDFLQLKNH